MSAVSGRRRAPHPPIDLQSQMKALELENMLLKVQNITGFVLYVTALIPSYSAGRECRFKAKVGKDRDRVARSQFPLTQILTTSINFISVLFL